MCVTVMRVPGPVTCRSRLSVPGWRQVAGCHVRSAARSASPSGVKERSVGDQGLEEAPWGSCPGASCGHHSVKLCRASVTQVPFCYRRRDWGTESRSARSSCGRAAVEAGLSRYREPQLPFPGGDDVLQEARLSSLPACFQGQRQAGKQRERSVHRPGSLGHRLPWWCFLSWERRWAANAHTEECLQVGDGSQEGEVASERD